MGDCGIGIGSGQGTIFSCDISNLCADQRSQVRGYKDCLPHGSSLTSTAVFLPQWIRRDHFHLILLHKH